MFRDRQRPDSFAGYRKDRVANRGRNWRQCRFAETGRRIVGLQEMNFDFRRGLRDTNGLILMEVALDGPSLIERDFPIHHVAQALNNRALDLVQRIARVDDLAADVGGYPDLLHLDLVARIDADLGDVSEVARVGG